MPNCPNCGEPTKRTVDWACQLCGYPLLSKSYMKIAKTYKQIKEERSHEQLSHPTEDTTSTEIGLTVDELFSICTSNQVEKDTIFNNKILSVTGVVAKTVVDYDVDIYCVSLTGAQKNRECSVNCMFDKKDASQLNELTEGQTITIEGKYDSYELNIIIKDCNLVSSPAREETPSSMVSSDLVVKTTDTSESESNLVIEPKTMLETEPNIELEPKGEMDPELVLEPKPELDITALEVTVDELLSIYAVDGTAADERFGGKILKITGEVNRIEVKDYLDIDYINLTSSENETLDHIRCFFDKKHESELNQLTKGQKVTVQGIYDGSIINMRLIGCVLVSDNI